MVTPAPPADNSKTTRIRGRKPLRSGAPWPSRGYWAGPVERTNATAPAGTHARRNSAEDPAPSSTTSASIPRCRGRARRTLGRDHPDRSAHRQPVVVAHAGYWHQRQMEHIVSDGMTVLVAPDAGLRKGRTTGMNRWLLRVHAPRPGRPRGARALPPAPDHHRAPLRSDQLNRAIKRFQRRGRSACKSEGRLLAATQNLLKLHNHRLVPATS
jgi:hypothetical protein